ncbi:MAG TPA: four helix bundle protein [Anaerolineales bacterium]|nr:four helix bundle protein [Anaerolineales bacterium]
MMQDAGYRLQDATCPYILQPISQPISQGVPMSWEDDFARWQESVPPSIRNDPLWRAEYYRLALFLYELVWDDIEHIRRDLRGKEIARQLIRSAGSVTANLEEAFGRGIDSADGQRVLRIALGECRETRGWYFRLRRLLPQATLAARLDILTRLIAMLTAVHTTYRRKHR